MKWEEGAQGCHAFCWVNRLLSTTNYAFMWKSFEKSFWKSENHLNKHRYTRRRFTPWNNRAMIPMSVLWPGFYFPFLAPFWCFYDSAVATAVYDVGLPLRQVLGSNISARVCQIVDAHKIKENSFRGITFELVWATHVARKGNERYSVRQEQDQWVRCFCLSWCLSVLFRRIRNFSPLWYTSVERLPSCLFVCCVVTRS